jgi:hypothetical protein
MYQMKKGGSAKTKKQQAAIAISMKKAGKKPKMKMGGGVDNSNFAKLAPPYDKATYADKIAGAKGATPKKKSGGSVGSSKKIKTYKAGGALGPEPVDKKNPTEDLKRYNQFIKDLPSEYRSNFTNRGKMPKVSSMFFKKRMGGTCGTPKSLRKGK